MKIKIKTCVNSDLVKVREGFSEDLFLKLNPSFPPVRLLEFDGCKTGDKVSLELNFILFRQKWISKIVDDGETDVEWYFVDEGVKLPFFLKTWTHRHVVKREKGSVSIIDDITYGTGTVLTDLLMYPILLGQFMYRKPIYRKVFK